MNIPTYHLGYAAELCDVTEEQLQAWVDKGWIPTVMPEPGPWPQVARIEQPQLLLIHALKAGKTVEEGRREVLAATTRVFDDDWHRPESKTDQEKYREDIENDRKELFQRLRRGA